MNRYCFLNISADFEGEILNIEEATANSSTHSENYACDITFLLTNAMCLVTRSGTTFFKSGTILLKSARLSR